MKGIPQSAKSRFSSRGRPMFIDSSEVISDFDPHFKVFHDLMPFKVQAILLISSLYDAFIMEEDGSLATRLIHEYHGLNLSKPPKITRASSAEEALQLIKARDFDLVITMPYLGGMDAFALGAIIKNVKPDLPVILVAHNMRATFPEKLDSQGVDKIFLWCCSADLLLAIIKNVEDHRNVDLDTRRAMVRVIIYVEDSPLYRSLFLPLHQHPRRAPLARAARAALRRRFLLRGGDEPLPEV